MSPSKRITSVATAFAAAFGIVAIAAAFAIGMTGWPPARATAAPTPAVPEFGVDEDSAVTLASEIDPAEKFVAPAAGGASASKAVKRLRTTESKKVTKPAVKRLSPKDAHSRSLPAAKRMTGKGWRVARASWYGPGFYGNTMAGGGRLTRTSMVVAHRSLPFGTRLQISYRGRTVTAVVRDRGPYIAGRTFDLGPGTAKALGFGGVGTIKYRIAKR